ncbi:MAG TPA: polysaccharide biosynthesis/export family protein [Bryobacteraceae bacterium]|nr:polysaccharide biosynthesis/export family protein [Bryobacteraceae bacterium]
MLACAAGGEAPTAAGAGYILGPDDQVSVHVLDVDEIADRPLRIERNGTVRLPLAGRVQAAGLTAEQLEAGIADRLRTYVKNPQVTVSIAEYRSQPVSVLGAVASPGVLQLQGRKTLFEVLSLAGGLRQDAGHSIRITRLSRWGAIPLAGAAPDATRRYSVAQVLVKSVLEARNPQENIAICPEDVISVPRAEMVYVIGAVRRAGGFVLNENENMTVLQALSLAEGLERTAAPRRARVLQPSPGQASRRELQLDLGKIIAGRAADLPLAAGDILFVPGSTAKSATLRGFEAAVQIGTGVAIWRH